MASHEQKKAIQEWMQHHFPDAQVTTDDCWDVSKYFAAGQKVPTDLQHEGGVMFGARDESGPASRKELGIAERAFLEHSISDVLSALDRHCVADRLRTEPGTQLFLDRELHVRELGKSSNGTGR